MKIHKPVIAMVVFICCTALSVFAGGGRESRNTATGSMNTDIDYLGIAAIMIRDGHFDKALNALSTADVESGEIELNRFHTLSGLVALHFAEYPMAVEHFEAAVALGQSDPLVFAYLGQAYFATGAYRESIAAIDRLSDFDVLPDILGVKSYAQWNLGDVSNAFATLDDAIARYPDRRKFLRQRILYLIDLDLTREAADESLPYLAQVGDDPNEYLAIGEALRRGGQIDEAITTLEMANLRFPGNDRVLAALARAYFDFGSTVTAASLLEEASHVNGDHAYDAAEYYRRAGMYTRALYLNTLVTDEAKKVSQKLTILIEMHKYEDALGLVSRLRQVGLLEDDAYLYAVAYLCFQVGDFERSTGYVDQLRNGDYSQQAAMLEVAIQTASNRKVPYF